jgi:hypothetical protein
MHLYIILFVERTNRNALDFGVWISNGEVVEKEHAVKGFGQELDLRLSRQLASSRGFHALTRM